MAPPLNLMPKSDFFADTLLSFVRRRGAKKDPQAIEDKPEPKKSKKKDKDKDKDKEKAQPGLVERSTSRVVRDGHDVLNEAVQLLEQYGSQLGSDIGFYQHRIQQLRASNPVKGRLSKKRKVSPEFIRECQVLLEDIQKSLGIYPTNGPLQPRSHSRSRSRSRSSSPLPFLLRVPPGDPNNTSMSPKVSFEENELGPAGLKRSASKRKKKNSIDQQQQQPLQQQAAMSSSDLKRNGTAKSKPRSKDQDGVPNGAPPPELDPVSGYAEGSNIKSRKYDKYDDRYFDKKRDYDRDEDDRYRSRDDGRREKYSSRRHRNDSYDSQDDYYRDRDRDRRYRHDRYYSDSRDKDRYYYDSKGRKHRSKRSPSPIGEANDEYGGEPPPPLEDGAQLDEEGGPSSSRKRRKRKERRPSYEGGAVDMERGESDQPQRVVLDNVPLHDVPQGAGLGVWGGMEVQPTVVEFPREEQDEGPGHRDQGRYRDKDRGDRDRDRDRERRYKERDRRDRDKEKDREREKEKDRGDREKDAGREERDRGKEREKDGEKDRDREKDKDRNKDKDKYRDRDRDYDRDYDRYRDRDRDREYRRRDYPSDDREYEYERSRRAYEDDKYRSHRSRKDRDRPDRDKDRGQYYEEKVGGGGTGGRREREREQRQKNHPYEERDPTLIAGEEDAAGSRFMELFSPAGGVASSLPRPPESVVQG